MEILLAGILAIIAWFFTRKVKEEKAINSAKIPPGVKEWRPFIASASQEFNVPFAIAMSVLWVESAGDADAIGSAGETGLMQLKPIAVADVEQFYPNKDFSGWQFKPEQNIRAGVAFLAVQYSRTGNWYEAVKAYNQGYQGMKNYPERANNYLAKVKAKEKFFA